MSNQSISKQSLLTASFPPDFTYITDARQASTVFFVKKVAIYVRMPDDMLFISKMKLQETPPQNLSFLKYHEQL